jgi:hypothetical protein
VYVDPVKGDVRAKAVEVAIGLDEVICGAKSGSEVLACAYEEREMRLPSVEVAILAGDVVLEVFIRPILAK